MANHKEVEYVSDANGTPLGVIVPIELWREIEAERETAYLLKSETMKRRLLEFLFAAAILLSGCSGSTVLLYASMDGDQDPLNQETEPEADVDETVPPLDGDRSRSARCRIRDSIQAGVW